MISSLINHSLTHTHVHNSGQKNKFREVVYSIGNLKKKIKKKMKKKYVFFSSVFLKIIIKNVLLRETITSISFLKVITTMKMFHGQSKSRKTLFLKYQQSTISKKYFLKWKAIISFQRKKSF